MKVLLNGHPKDLESGVSLGDLLRLLGLEGNPVAVEVNRRVVPRAEHPVTKLEEGDRVEVVHFVGGG